MAAMNFEPAAWAEMTHAFREPSWSKTSEAIRFDLFVAARFVEVTTKADAIKFARQEQDTFQETVDSLIETKKLLESYISLINTAASRLLIAGAVVALGKAA